MNTLIQKYLLSLARKTIAEDLGVEYEVLPRPDDAKILNEKRGVFVTLNMGKTLRGCIGNIIPIYTLENAVKRNAINAAFEDPRFWPLTSEEFEEVKIEISVLTVPKRMEYKGVDEMLAQIRPNIDGVILRKLSYEATYLPQVWEDLPDKEQFLGSLCLKAGMNAGEWKKADLVVSTYQAEVFGE